ncbi:MAG: endolytic transglycosylase MltG [Blastocatellia bacterium]|nr:endolytic transglycosylase MltG [Blastocatellia bacterium]
MAKPFSAAPRKKSRRLLPSLFFGFLLIAGGLSFWVYANLTTPLAHNAAEKIITLEPGLGTRGILVRLSSEGILSNRFPLLAYLALKREGRPLQAGDYKFESPITPLQVLDKLQRGQVVMEQLTIPEGLNVFEVAEILEERESGQTSTGLSPEAALRQTELISDLDPKATNLEGYLFPDTYTFTRRTTDAQLVGLMVKHFHEVFTPEMRAQATKLGLTVRQAVTLASVIEKEAKVDEDRPLISSVIHNRLKKGMRLECDPTFMYGAMVDKTWDGNVNNPAHRRSTSPYNTYFVTGLPPGPIASPGRKSLQAALYPATTEYLFFVLGEGGKHRFSRTQAEHETAVAEYRRLVAQGKIGK